jgi:predicted NUDIX family phosphoesterase
MSSTAKQLVLAARTSLFDEIGHFQGYSLDPSRYLDRIFAPGGSSFILRDEAEVNPAYKQLIPYVVLVCEGRALSYVRGKEADEARLHSMRSVGFGGHIEPSDESLFFSPLQLYRKAAEREVLEEVNLRTTYTEEVVGLINDDSNEVGRVHLGIVHVWSLAEPLVAKRERQISAIRFLDLHDLEKVSDHLESWSKIAIEIIRGKGLLL